MEIVLVRQSRGRFFSAAAAAVALGALLLLCGSCGTYQGQSAEIKRSFSESDYENALAGIEEIDKGNSELLYLYEKGLILHYRGDFAGSNDVFERAELLLEELYTKSVSRELAALALSDNITKYRGATHEAVLVNYYKILNYLYLGDVDGALVECRRVNRKLEYLRDAEDVFFVDDPFIQFLTGMVYRLGSEFNDADVSFRVALEGYEVLGTDYGVAVPGPLRCDVVEAAMRLGDVVDDSTAGECSGEPPPDSGVLNLFLECGYVAHLQERTVVLPIFKDDDASDVDALAEVLAAREGVAGADYYSGKKVDYILKVAMPALVPTPVPWDYAVVTPVARAGGDGADNPARVDSETGAFAGVVENVDAFAAADFEAGYGKVLFRTVVRGLTKYAAKEGASKKDEGLGWLVNWFNAATESADTRSWSTLPEKILMSRLLLPEGVYDLQVDLYDSLGQRVERLRIEEVAVTAGSTTFLNHRIF